MAGVGAGDAVAVVAFDPGDGGVWRSRWVEMFWAVIQGRWVPRREERPRTVQIRPAAAGARRPAGSRTRRHHQSIHYGQCEVRGRAAREVLKIPMHRSRNRPEMKRQRQTPPSLSEWRSGTHIGSWGKPRGRGFSGMCARTTARGYQRWCRRTGDIGPRPRTATRFMRGSGGWHRCWPRSPSIAR